MAVGDTVLTRDFDRSRLPADRRFAIHFGLNCQASAPTGQMPTE
jgi:hypothetical protein